jgi:hypothetical protein
MKRQIELVRYGSKKQLIKSSVLLILTTFIIFLQCVNCVKIYEESDSLLDSDASNRNSDVNGEYFVAI